MSIANQRARCATQLQKTGSRVATMSVFLGMDGFVDEIFHVVDKRHSAESYDRLPTIAKFAERMAHASGKSANLEIVSQVVKLGGNGPIMANALASLGFPVTYLGNLGYPNLHPVFEDFAKRATAHSIAEPGLTDALEFEDGKIMVGKHSSLREVNWENIKERFGLEQFRESLKRADLIGSVNWTMYAYMSDIWEAILTEVTPALTKRRRRMFLDLADPEKRSPADIERALELIQRFQSHFEVVLGLNEKESVEIAEVLALSATDHSVEGLSALAQEIRSRVQVDTVVIHPTASAVAASGNGTSSVAGPFTAKPRITTGAGDHFNAGFCLGRMLDFSNDDSLLLGVTASGFYVRTARSPAIADLVETLQNWPYE